MYFYICLFVILELRIWLTQIRTVLLFTRPWDMCWFEYGIAQIDALIYPMCMCNAQKHFTEMKMRLSYEIVIEFTCTSTMIRLLWLENFLLFFVVVSDCFIPHRSWAQNWLWLHKNLNNFRISSCVCTKRFQEYENPESVLIENWLLYELLPGFCYTLCTRLSSDSKTFLCHDFCLIHSRSLHAFSFPACCCSSSLP